MIEEMIEMMRLSRRYPQAMLTLGFLATWFLGVDTPKQSLAAEDRAASALHQPESRCMQLDGPWTLKDYRGGELTSAAFAQRRVVFAFLGTECPLAKFYARRLSEIEEKYSSLGVDVIAVMSNQQDSLSDIARFVKQQNIRYAVTVDPGAKFAQRLGAQRTPEVFLYDTDGRLRYSGRIDDQYGIGVIREAPTKNELQSAIEAIVHDRPLLVTRTEAVGCIIGRAKEPVDTPTVTYAEHIAPLLNAHCVACHRSGDIGPFAMTDYDEVAGWAEMIAEVARDRRMPPWHAAPEFGHFANENRLSPQQIQLLDRWVEQGAPQGDESMIPEVPSFAEGWLAQRQPDLIVDLTDEPVFIPADGEVKYQYYRVKTDLKHDRWVVGSQFLPGNRAVVHHILAFVKEPGSQRRFNAERGFFAGYVPGMRATMWPQGYAKRLPAGSELVFQVHYTPIGSPQEDQSQLGLWFADDSEVTHHVFTSSAVQSKLKIPPGEADYVTQASAQIEFEPGAELLALAPHMHVRGKAFRYELISGTSRRTLLDIPAYDFNWQTQYLLAEPLKLDPANRIHCIAHYDNSADNLSNPDPDRWVTWGDQTWDEMMIGYFHWALPRGQDKGSEQAKGRKQDKGRKQADGREHGNEGGQPEQPSGDSEGSSSAAPGASASSESESSEPGRRRAFVKQLATARLLKRMDHNGDGKLQRSEVPEQHQATFDRLDEDHDDIVTRAELQKL